MKRVAASEHDLLVVVRALVGHISPEAAGPLVRQGRTLAPHLGPTALGVLRDTLAKGAVLALCCRGGWIFGEQLDAQGAPRAGRIWERLPAPELRFTLSSLELCRWLVSAPLASPDAPHFKLQGAEVSAGDELLLYLACELVNRCGCADAIAASQAFRCSPLCWLGFADVLARGGPPTPRELPDAAFAPLFSPPRRFLLEALQGDLCRRWVEMERGKARPGAARRLLALGQAQGNVLQGVAGAADGAGRRDLLGFVWRAGARLLRHRPVPEKWVAPLSHESSLEERSEACRAGAAFLRSLIQLQGWIEEARSRRFFDDDYAATQLLLRQWDELGTSGSQHAQQVVDALEALDAPLRVEAAATEVGG